ncbi:MAG: fluoride efflux transporter CrcB [Myxococcales bacterium]|jgi:CrcB protein|nr:fluoride efflux transporter CrcB [Myxococcales bacterium]
MQRLLWVCFAGAIGAGTRYLVSVWAARRFGDAFPVGTLLVNVAGCFLMGLVMQASVSLASFPLGLRVALTSGFLGGLTTYSAFAYETTKLAQDGTRGVALVNLAVTTAACFVAVVLGLAAGRALKD